jgi:hypothetical protein
VAPRATGNPTARAGAEGGRDLVPAGGGRAGADDLAVLRDLALFLADGQGKTDWATVQAADLETSSPCARQAGPGG